MIFNAMLTIYLNTLGFLELYCLDYNPLTYAMTFTSLVHYHTLMDSHKDAQQRLFIHCEAEVFIMPNIQPEG